MVHVSDPRFLVAHRLRVRGFSTAAVIAEAVGIDDTGALVHLRALEAAGHARFRDGRPTGWTLTPEGRVQHAAACLDELAASGCETAVRAGYAGFLERNGELLRVCTDWQLVDETTLNDHTGRAYDDAVVGRLVALHAGVSPVLAALGEAMPRFAGYGPRLTHAVERIQSGEHDWFTGAMIDSYHTVWFELHEDLLATLDIERAREGE